jgi:hypothetical protein
MMVKRPRNARARSYTAVAVLASEEAGWIAGQMIIADGGLARH